MSLQAGVWNLDGRPINREILAKISSVSAEQGPDGETTHFDGPMGMLYRPFHTTAESRLKHQPHSFANGKIITWDGRLDNSDDLIRELRNDLGDDQTDVAIAGAAFERWRTESFRKLIGDWALSLWDPSRNELILARDCAGVKHLFYHQEAGAVTWCSHLAALAFCGRKLTLCDEYIAGYLAHFPQAHLTPYREISAVSPGSFVRLQNGLAKESSYLSCPLGKTKIRYRSDGEYEEHFRYLFRRAVSRRLRSDAPVLAELSGGIDSSSIVCMADDILAQGEAATQRVDTVSFYDPRVPQADERSFVAQIEERRGRKGHHVNLAEPNADFFGLGSDELLAAPGPSQQLDETRSRLLSLFQGPGYRVVISGMGGDEFLGGVNDPSSRLADLIVSLRPVKLARALAAWSKVNKRSQAQLLLQALGLVLPRSFRAPFAKNPPAKPLVHPTFASRWHLGVRRLGPQGSYGFWLPTRREFAQRLETVRRQLGSPLSLMRCEEVRYPFLDVNLLEFLSSIPVDQLLRPGQPRSLMRRALANIVPAGVLWRSTKGGGSLDFSVSFERNWPELEKLLGSSLSGRMGYLDQASFLELLRRDMSRNQGRVIHRAKEVFLELWLRSLAEHGVICLPSDILRGRADDHLDAVAGEQLEAKASMGMQEYPS